MASKDYLDILNNQVRKKSLKLTALQEKKVMKAYSNLGEELLKNYMSFDSSPYQKKMLQEQILHCNNQVENIIKEYSQLQAENVVSAHMEVFKDTFKDYNIDKDFLNKFANIDKNCVDYILKGNLYSNGKGLSERIWNTGKIQDKNIQDIIIQGRLQGLGAVKLGALLEAYTNNSSGAWVNACKKLGAGYASQITKAGVSYEALRLARTTITHTAQVALITSSKFNPFIEGLQWHTSNGGRVCNDCASKNGVIYNKNEVPFDHPNGMCYQTAVITKDTKEIASEIRNWVHGAENPALDTWAKQMGTYSAISPSRLITSNANHQTSREDLRRRNYRVFTDRFEVRESSLASYEGKYLTTINPLNYKALKEYTGSSYVDINRQLRNGEDKGKSAIIRNISRAISKFESTEDFVVHRGTSINAIKGLFSSKEEFDEVYEKCLMGEATQEYLDKKFIGGVLVDKGFMSTSVLNHTAFEKDIGYHINIPKGTKYGAYINELSNYKDKEYEFLLDKNLATEVTKVQLNRNGRIELFLDIIGYAD